MPYRPERVITNNGEWSIGFILAAQDQIIAWQFYNRIRNQKTIDCAKFIQFLNESVLPYD